MNADLEALVHVMPPQEGAGQTIDWARAEAAWGVVFPADYKEFVSV